MSLPNQGPWYGQICTCRTGYGCALHPVDRSSFGGRLRELRVGLGLGLREAADLLGTTPVRLGEVERGVRKP